MKQPKYSIWRGDASFFWAIAIVVLLLSEALTLYGDFSDKSINFWSLSTYYVPVMITLPLSVAVNGYRKFAQSLSSENDDFIVTAYSRSIAIVVLIANITSLICLQNSYTFHLFRPK